MSLVTVDEVRRMGAGAILRKTGSIPYQMSRATAGFSDAAAAGAILREMRAAESTSAPRPHDIFLSHSFSDQILILGTKFYLESFGYTVYVDWIDDAELDRTRVTKETARRLRSRMQTCRSLLFATTSNSSNSKWMPWELGYVDGRKGRTGIFPLAQGSGHEVKYVGQEYLGLYPYLVRSTVAGKEYLYMHNSETKWVLFSAWLEGKDPPA